MSALAPLTAGVQRRLMGLAPTAQQLRVAEKYKGADDLRCRNGKRSDRPECGDFGSMNQSVNARAVLGHWAWFTALAMLELDEGLWGRELGTDSHHYHSGVFDARLLACQELRLNGYATEADLCRRVLRAALAWDLLVALPVNRVRDQLNEAGVVREMRATKKAPRYGVLTAVAGNRYNVEERQRGSGWSTDGSHDSVLTQRFAVLMGDERAVANACVYSFSVGAAQEVASWMVGTIHNPNVTWSWRLRRTTHGTESVFFGPWANPHKPARQAAQALWDGTLRTLQASPRGKKKWGPTGEPVEIRNGVIRAVSKTGEASMDELTGRILWQVDVIGNKVDFLAGAA